jgi:hypothetical protein
MKFFLLWQQRPYGDYAGFSHLGTWSESRLCPKCGRHSSRLVEPLLVEFEPGSDVLADFMWCGYSFIVLPPVRAFLEHERFGCSFGRVEVVQPSTATRKRRVVYPYVGPELTWVKVIDSVSIDAATNNLAVATCTNCHRTKIGFKQTGLILSKSEWHGSKMFRVAEYSPTVAYITEGGLDDLLTEGFSNLGFIEAGEFL